MSKKKTEQSKQSKRQALIASCERRAYARCIRLLEVFRFAPEPFADWWKIVGPEGLDPHVSDAGISEIDSTWTVRHAPGYVRVRSARSNEESDEMVDESIHEGEVTREPSGEDDAREESLSEDADDDDEFLSDDDEFLSDDDEFLSDDEDDVDDEAIANWQVQSVSTELGHDEYVMSLCTRATAVRAEGGVVLTRRDSDSLEVMFLDPELATAYRRCREVVIAASRSAEPRTDEDAAPTTGETAQATPRWVKQTRGEDGE